MACLVRWCFNTRLVIISVSNRSNYAPIHFYLDECSRRVHSVLLGCDGLVRRKLGHEQTFEEVATS